MTEITLINPVHELIAKTVAENPIVLFMKGAPAAPHCGFSAAVVSILDHLGVTYIGVDIMQNEALRQGLRRGLVGL